MSERAEANRKKAVVDLLRKVPFREFYLRLDSGDRLDIAHPESIAFDPEPCGGTDVYIRTREVRVYTTFDAITAVAANVPGETVEG